MLTPRFHCPHAVPGLAPGHRLELPATAAHHALRVLRLVDGDPIAVFSGLGGEYAAVLEATRGKAAHARVADFHAEDRAPRIDVHIQQSVVSNDKMDWMIEKAVELGARSVTPVLVERSVVRLNGERAERRVAHWQALAIAASEQCGLNRVLDVSPVQSVDEACSALPALNTLRCMLDPRGERSLTDCISEVWPSIVPDGVPGMPTAALVLLVGPEGGFSARETAHARGAGYLTLSLGPRVLRTETAALAALAAIRALVDDFRPLAAGCHTRASASMNAAVAPT
ncbi:MAG: 16S rRNA (uracil(1498)-N(3))-methyltransferase [Proteobacteria bacterium]|nr:16S rRNA (uracil(1498)-N(3))-methyltransferase [Burkholderiales bacterium]